MIKQTKPSINLQEHKRLPAQLEAWKNDCRPYLLKRLAASPGNCLYVKLNCQSFLVYEPDGTPVNIPGARIPEKYLGIPGADVEDKFYKVTKDMLEHENFPPQLGIEMVDHLRVKEHNAEVDKKRAAGDPKPGQYKKYRMTRVLFDKRPLLEVADETEFTRGLRLRSDLDSPLREFILSGDEVRSIDDYAPAGSAHTPPGAAV